MLKLTQNRKIMKKLLLFILLLFSINVFSQEIFAIKESAGNVYYDVSSTGAVVLKHTNLILPNDCVVQWYDDANKTTLLGTGQDFEVSSPQASYFMTIKSSCGETSVIETTLRGGGNWKSTLTSKTFSYFETIESVNKIKIHYTDGSWEWYY